MRRVYWCLLYSFVALMVLSIPLTAYTICYLSHKPRAILAEKWRLFDDEQSAKFYLPAFYVESIIAGQSVRAAVYSKRHPEDLSVKIFTPVRSTPPGPKDPSAHYALDW